METEWKRLIITIEKRPSPKHDVVGDIRIRFETAWIVDDVLFLLHEDQIKLSIGHVVWQVSFLSLNDKIHLKENDQGV